MTAHAWILVRNAPILPTHVRRATRMAAQPTASTVRKRNVNLALLQWWCIANSLSAKACCLALLNRGWRSIGCVKRRPLCHSSGAGSHHEINPSPSSLISPMTSNGENGLAAVPISLSSPVALAWSRGVGGELKRSACTRMRTCAAAACSGVSG